MGLMEAVENNGTGTRAPFEKGMYIQQIKLDDTKKMFIGMSLDKNGNAMCSATTRLLSKENGEEAPDLRVYNSFYRLNLPGKDSKESIDLGRFASMLASCGKLTEFVETFGNDADFIGRVDDMDIWLKFNLDGLYVLGYVHEVDKFPKEENEDGTNKKVLANRYFTKFEGEQPSRVDDMPADMPF